MLLEANQLAGYYQTPVGAAVQAVIADRLVRFWPQVKGLRLLGYGYALPYLQGWAGQAERAVALVPAQIGVPPEPAAAALGQEDALPFADAFFDRILIVHGLEGAENARAFLRQVWRVLAPEGRIVVVAPNRVSPWALAECSPFACGRPFRKSELDALLRDALLEPVAWERALYPPPQLIGSVRTVPWREKLGRRILPCFAGVLMVEAKKTIYGVTPLREVKKAATMLVGA
jgi:SAM-dependent methyltransferase